MKSLFVSAAIASLLLALPLFASMGDSPENMDEITMQTGQQGHSSMSSSVEENEVEMAMEPIGEQAASVEAFANQADDEEVKNIEDFAAMTEDSVGNPTVTENIEDLNDDQSSNQNVSNEEMISDNNEGENTVKESIQTEEMMDNSEDSSSSDDTL